MIFAPRSCPSRPGLAMTTRMVPATMQVYEGDCRGPVPPMKLTVVGSSPAWPNPGGAQSGYIVEGPGRLLLDCGPGVLARLREQDGWPRVDAIAITHFHLDHWGDLVPWVWGRMYGLGQDLETPELWVQPRGRAQLQEFGERLGMRDMFDRTFEVKEYGERELVVAADLHVSPLRVPHYWLQTHGFRATSLHGTRAYSGDSGPSDLLAHLAQDVDLFLCEATLERGELDGQPRGHLSLEE